MASNDDAIKIIVKYFSRLFYCFFFFIVFVRFHTILLACAVSLIENFNSNITEKHKRLFVKKKRERETILVKYCFFFFFFSWPCFTALLLHHPLLSLRHGHTELLIQQRETLCFGHQVQLLINAVQFLIW